jgi:hypothetical protein
VQPIRNRQVIGSNPIGGSNQFKSLKLKSTGWKVLKLSNL